MTPTKDHLDRWIAQIGCSKTTVVTCIDELLQQGVVLKQERRAEHGGANSNLYTITHQLSGFYES